MSDEQPKSRLALVLLLALVMQQAHSSDSRRNSHKQDYTSRQSRKEIDPKDVWIDAFDMDKCGQMPESTIRAWQAKQSVFGCAREVPRPKTRMRQDTTVARGVRQDPAPAERDLPFQVKLFYPGCRKQCHGILVNNDLVVTSAACLSDPRCYTGLASFVPGNGHRTSSKWCWPSEDSGISNKHALAVIKFDEPVKYVPDVLSPACLMIDDKRQSEEATCVLSGVQSPAGDGLIMLPVNVTRLPSKVTIHTVKRNCDSDLEHSRHESCYKVAGKGGKACEMFSGASVACFDRCSSKEPDRVQAFAMGVAGGWRKCDSERANTTTDVVDFQKLKWQLLDMLKVIKDNKKGSYDTFCRHWKEI